MKVSILTFCLLMGLICVPLDGNAQELDSARVTFSAREVAQFRSVALRYVNLMRDYFETDDMTTGLALIPDLFLNEGETGVYNDLMADGLSKVPLRRYLQQIHREEALKVSFLERYVKEFTVLSVFDSLIAIESTKIFWAANKTEKARKSSMLIISPESLKIKEIMATETFYSVFKGQFYVVRMGAEPINTINSNIGSVNLLVHNEVKVVEDKDAPVIALLEGPNTRGFMNVNNARDITPLPVGDHMAVYKFPAIQVSYPTGVNVVVSIKDNSGLRMIQVDNEVFKLGDGIESIDGKPTLEWKRSFKVEKNGSLVIVASDIKGNESEPKEFFVSDIGEEGKSAENFSVK